MSSNEFSNQFQQQVTDLIASHWEQLGVGLTPGNRAQADTWIDLESLMAFTLLVPHGDKRILEGALEWTIQNRNAINTSRLKRVGNLLAGSRPQYNRKSVQDLLNDIASGDMDRFVQRVAEQMSTTFYSTRGILGAVNLANPRLTQLKLRAMFGINARAEILMYLLQHPSQNSNAMARQIGFAQKQVYLILENWTAAGIVRRIQQGRAGNYSLTRPEKWKQALELTKIPAAINWMKTFHTLSLIMDIVAETDDIYMLSSRFRDVTPQVQLLLSSMNLHLPDPRNFPGEAYFLPFAETIFKAINRLG